MPAARPHAFRMRGLPAAHPQGRHDDSPRGRNAGDEAGDEAGDKAGDEGEGEVRGRGERER